MKRRTKTFFKWVLYIVGFMIVSSNIINGLRRVAHVALNTQHQPKPLLRKNSSLYQQNLHQQAENARKVYEQKTRNILFEAARKVVEQDPSITELAKVDECSNLFSSTEEPLLYYASVGCNDSIMSLMNRGVNINSRNSKRQTGLMFAAANGHTDTVRFLLDKGANIHAKDSSGRTALDFAKNNCFYSSNLLLVESINDENKKKLKDNCCNQIIDILTSTAQHKVVQHTVPGKSRTIKSAKKTYETAFSRFTEKRFNQPFFTIPSKPQKIDKVQLNKALVEAVKKGDADVVRALLKGGANINTKIKGSITLLHVAVVLGHSETIQVLLESGADINAATKNGITPLMWAVGKGKTKIVKLLLRNGADINAKADKGITAV